MIIKKKKKNTFLTIIFILLSFNLRAEDFQFPNLDNLDYEVKQSIEMACFMEKGDGPAIYAQCIKGYLKDIGIE